MLSLQGGNREVEETDKMKIFQLNVPELEPDMVLITQSYSHPSKQPWIHKKPQKNSIVAIQRLVLQSTNLYCWIV